MLGEPRVGGLVIFALPWKPPTQSIGYGTTYAAVQLHVGPIA
jgi:hypothetical protein